MLNKLTLSMLTSVLLVIGAATSYASAIENTFTLYRSSVTDPTMRLHVATFDADESANYNRENCELAAGLFKNQDSVKVAFWCESGRFSKSASKH